MGRHTLFYKRCKAIALLQSTHKQRALEHKCQQTTVKARTIDGVNKNHNLQEEGEGGGRRVGEGGGEGWVVVVGGEREGRGWEGEGREGGGRGEGEGKGRGSHFGSSHFGSRRHCLRVFRLFALFIPFASQ